MCIYCDYCVYHYKSTELVSLYTLDIGLKINIIIIIRKSKFYTRIIINSHALFHNYKLIYMYYYFLIKNKWCIFVEYLNVKFAE